MRKKNVGKKEKAYPSLQQNQEESEENTKKRYFSLLNEKLSTISSGERAFVEVESSKTMGFPFFFLFSCSNKEISG